MVSFAELSLTSFLADRLQQAGFTAPTPIQAAAIPLALEGRDLSPGEDGKRKTLAFLIPLIERAVKEIGSLPAIRPRRPDRPGRREHWCWRRPASWPFRSRWSSRKYAPPSVTSLAVYGGVPIDRHYRALRQAPMMIVIGTPGRLLDVAGTRHLDLRGVEYVVMDEADQMLDRGFLRDIQRILQLLPAQRQTMLFSATFSPEILTLAESMLKNPARTSVDPGVNSPTKITPMPTMWCRARPRGCS